jgi:FtsP/CotA-like multicopper oxidase with cupredoxin domain
MSAGTSGMGIVVEYIVKDVVNVPAHKIEEVDFVAANPGLTLLHCHMQEHMDFGFMNLDNYI